MKKLTLTLNGLSLVFAGASIALFATNNVGDAVYFVTWAVCAKLWAIERG
jgi:hypothetical protein